MVLAEARMGLALKHTTLVQLLGLGLYIYGEYFTKFAMASRREEGGN